MKLTSNHRMLTYSMIVISCLLLCYNNTFAAPTEPPLAKASDIEFTVEYSSDKLMLGDILFAQVTIKNKSAHTVRVSSFHALVIRAKTPKATQLAQGFGEYPGGTTLLELTTGQEIVFEVVLDVFGDDGSEDGTFDLFDSGLEGQKVSLHAVCSTQIPHRLKDLDYGDFLLEHTHLIEFGRPLISRHEFDDAVSEVLNSDDLELLSFAFSTGQLSYLFTQTNDLRRYTGDPRTYAAIINVLAERLPKESSARRAASLMLAVGGFLSSESSPVDEKTISEILSLLAQCSPAENAYWKSELLDTFNSEYMQRREGDTQRTATILSNRIRASCGN